MRLIDRFVDIVNRNPALVYCIQSLISSDRIVQRQIFEQLLEPVLSRNQQGLRVLDIASGSGHFAQVFDRSVDLFMSDMSVENCHYIFSRFHRPSVALDARSLPFSDGAFDLVICSAAFHHFDEVDATTIMEEAHRVLSNDGAFLLMDSYIPRKPGIAPWFFEWVERGEYLRSKDDMIRIARHDTIFKIEEMVDERQHYHFKQIYFLLAKGHN